jgi:pyochelin biosynthetic protein PchC
VVFAGRYPAREDRITEAAASSLAAMAEALTADIIASWPPGWPLVLFGHSLGASLAFEVAHRLMASRPVDLLVLSARAARDGVPDEEGPLADRITRLDPLFSQLAEHPELRDYALKLIADDIALLNAHQLGDKRLLGVPLLVVGGDSDHTCASADLAQWRHRSNGPFQQLSYPGGHFYLRDQADRLLADLVSHWTSLQAQSPA